MKQKQNYNKNTMNLKQLSRDLKKTGFTCKLSEDGDYLSFLDYVKISLTDYNDWSVTYYKPFKEITFYKPTTKWEVIKLLNKLLTEV